MLPTWKSTYECFDGAYGTSKQGSVDSTGWLRSVILSYALYNYDC